MRNKLFIVFTIVVVAVLNLLVYRNVELRRDSRVILMELRPVDPRSLMQGDYMILSYAIYNQIPRGLMDKSHLKGKIVVGTDKNNVGTFLRFYSGGKISQDEILVKYSNQYGWRMKLGSETFMFQEGQGGLYSDARYAEMSVDRDGNAYVIGLLDENFTKLGPKKLD